MESPAPPAMLQHLWKSALLSGILAVILGILVLACPGKTIIVAAIFFGAYLLVTGFAQVIFAFALHVSAGRSEEHTSELQSHVNLVCRLLLEKKKKKYQKSILYK